MRAITVVDPGHGGTTAVGQSTPFGVRGLNGLVEKNVALDLSQRVAQRLGTSVFLTRYGDVNLSLDDRARLASDLGAPAFLSLHGTAGGGGTHGSETWVHSHAGPASIALAEEVRDELGRLGIPDRGIHRGDLAVLNPRRHRTGCAACLVEVEHLDDQHGARLLSNPRALDAVADGLARSVDRYLSRADRSGSRAYAFGRGYSIGLDEALDLTDFPTNVFVVVPDTDTPTVPRQIRQSDHDALQRAWDCMMRGRGMIVDATDTLASGAAVDRGSEFRELLRGGLSDSPLFRQVYQEICCDETSPITMHIRSQFPGITIDAFRFDPTRPVGSRGGQAGHHTFDLFDLAQFPHVATTAQLNLSLKHQIVLHGLREARQGALGNNYFPSHFRAIDDENAFRTEQGQIGAKDHNQPTGVAGGMQQVYTHGGAVLLTETINMSGTDITSITQAP
jgi:N-acetylmuramoyl-L-alanine amidase